MAEQVEQIISNRYLVVEKLRSLLSERFGTDYSVTVSCGSYYLTVPERLTEEDIESCCD
ncbi:hypothetical protein BJY00DRAFT_315454 [Aspergillus carlsbadensis]|nr:hypothetical protein BJY00DRAFT_315454 [Aspergillus carlsbadensis]